MTKKKKFQIPVLWQMSDVLEIEADSLEEAEEIAHQSALTDGEYVETSFVVDKEDEIWHDQLTK